MWLYTYRDGLQSIVSAPIVTTNPVRDKSVGVSPKNRNPSIVAATGSAPAARIDTIPESLYLSAKAKKAYGSTEDTAP